jgi:plastocyanin domain-containing protein
MKWLIESTIILTFLTALIGLIIIVFSLRNATKEAKITAVKVQEIAVSVDGNMTEMIAALRASRPATREEKTLMRDEDS